MAKSFITFLLLSLIAAASAAAPAQSPAPPPEDCLSLMFNMMDCLSYLATTDEPKPGPICCNEFKAVVSANAGCICSALADFPSMGIEINMTRAIDISPECGVYDFSIIDCPEHISAAPAQSPVSNGPSFTPVESPASSSSTYAPAPAPAPAPTKSPAGRLAISGGIYAIFFFLIVNFYYLLV
ncbi:non-specific lipid transfer protein GPI-anchored 4-like [Andrographis paniculata]|uniref:non-specific lipid transfer protein GPI-anchored 4-like n=1 Tax=Andrographis paniculata TaxID=175694 RepID=UPI0021E9680E|nr:non-specific lipid transfer protein GPI-anchored 4-like [Andrographis paniculata]